jgi:hypothetical protein
VDLFASLPVSRTLTERNVNKNASRRHKLVLLTAKQSVLQAKRVELERNLGCPEVIEVVREKTSFHPNIDIESVIDQLKNSILELRENTTMFLYNAQKTLTSLYNRVNNSHDQSYHSMREIVKKNFDHICKVGFDFGVQLHSECIKFMTRDRAEEFSHGLAQFAIMWFQYLQRRNEKRKKNFFK